MDDVLVRACIYSDSVSALMHLLDLEWALTDLYGMGVTRSSGVQYVIKL